MGIEGYFIEVDTRHTVEVIDITKKIENIISSSDLSKGMVNVFSPHTTTAICVNESESRLMNDLKDGFYQLVDWEKGYQHNQIDRNAPAHLVSSFVGCQKTFNFSEGKIRLGTWQSIFFVELDGPRRRKVNIQLVGE